MFNIKEGIGDDDSIRIETVSKDFLMPGGNGYRKGSNGSGLLNSNLGYGNPSNPKDTKSGEEKGTSGENDVGASYINESSNENGQESQLLENAPEFKKTDSDPDEKASVGEDVKPQSDIHDVQTWETEEPIVGSCCEWPRSSEPLHHSEDDSRDAMEGQADETEDPQAVQDMPVAGESCQDGSDGGPQMEDVVEHEYLKNKPNEGQKEDLGDSGMASMKGPDINVGNVGVSTSETACHEAEQIDSDVKEADPSSLIDGAFNQADQTEQPKDSETEIEDEEKDDGEIAPTGEAEETLGEVGDNNTAETYAPKEGDVCKWACHLDHEQRDASNSNSTVEESQKKGEDPQMKDISQIDTESSMSQGSELNEERAADTKESEILDGAPQNEVVKDKGHSEPESPQEDLQSGNIGQNKKENGVNKTSRLQVLRIKALDGSSAHFNFWIDTKHKVQIKKKNIEMYVLCENLEDDLKEVVRHVGETLYLEAYEEEAGLERMICYKVPINWQILKNEIYLIHVCSSILKHWNEENRKKLLRPIFKSLRGKLMQDEIVTKLSNALDDAARLGPYFKDGIKKLEFYDKVLGTMPSKRDVSIMNRILGVPIVDLLLKINGIYEEVRSHGKATSPEMREKEQSDILLLEFVQNRILRQFYCGDKSVYVQMEEKGIPKTFLVGSNNFKQYITYNYYEEMGELASIGVIEKVVNYLKAQIIHEGELDKVFLRVAGRDKKIYFDLGNQNNEAVEIDAKGWRIIDRPPVCFIRGGNSLSLPVPIEGGQLSILKKYVNMTDDQFLMLCGFILGTFQPNGPFPVLNLQGMMGSGKSCLTKIIKNLIDPTTASLTGHFRSSDDILTHAQNTWLVCIDNISELSVNLSDLICRISTGAGYSKRKIYSDGEEYAYNVIRPVVLNGISFPGRLDLMDRAITLELDTINNTIPEREFLESFETEKPLILGAIFDGISEILRNYDNTDVPKLPRMADFSKWVVSAKECIDGKRFLELYMESRRDTQMQELEGDYLGRIVSKVICNTGDFEGTHTDLFNLLKSFYHDERKAFMAKIKNARSLSVLLSRIAPCLAHFGIRIQKGLPRRQIRVTMDKSYDKMDIFSL